MEVKVSQDKCIGCGRCIDSLNNVFGYNDEGLAHVVCEDNLEEYREDIEEIASGCPAGAIYIK